MAIPVNCPSCGFEGEAPDEQAGQSVLCPDCRANIPVPDSAAKKVRTSERFRDEPPLETRSRRGDVAPRDEFDEDDRPSRRRSRRSRGIGSVCDRCGSDAPPIVRSQVSPAGWIVLIAMIIFMPCLFWIGLLMKEEYRVCADCGARL